MTTHSTHDDIYIYIEMIDSFISRLIVKCKIILYIAYCVVQCKAFTST